MKMALLWTLLCMVAFHIIAGMSQAPVLTENIISNVTCSEETEIYICNSTSTLVQWIVEPFSNAALFVPSGSTIAPIEFQDAAIIIEQISRVPLITSLAVSGKVLETISVRCMDAIQDISSLEEFTYTFASTRTATFITSDTMSTEGMAILRVRYQPSVSPEVTHTLYYSGSSTIFDGTEATVVVSCDVGSLEFRVCVSNRCGQETCGETETIPVTCPDSPTSPTCPTCPTSPTCPCPSCVWCYVVLGIVGFCLLVVVTVVLVYVGYVKCCKKGKDEKGGSSIPLEAIADSESKMQ